MLEKGRAGPSQAVAGSGGGEFSVGPGRSNFSVVYETIARCQTLILEQNASLYLKSLVLHKLCIMEVVPYIIDLQFFGEIILVGP